MPYFHGMSSFERGMLSSVQSEISNRGVSTRRRAHLTSNFSYWDRQSTYVAKKSNSNATSCYEIETSMPHYFLESCLSRPIGPQFYLDCQVRETFLINHRCESLSNESSGGDHLLIKRFDQQHGDVPARAGVGIPTMKTTQNNPKTSRLSMVFVVSET